MTALSHPPRLFSTRALVEICVRTAGPRHRVREIPVEASGPPRSLCALEVEDRLRLRSFLLAPLGLYASAARKGGSLSAGGLKYTWYLVHFGMMGIVGGALWAGSAYGAAKKLGVPLERRVDDALRTFAVAIAVVGYHALVSCMVANGEARHLVSTELLLVIAAACGLMGAVSVWRGLRGARGRLV